MELDQPIIVDTDFLSDYLAKKPKAKRTIYNLLKEGLYIITTVITVSELYFGCNRRKWGQRRIKTLKKLITSIKVIDFTLEHAKEYGRLRASLVDKGQDIGFADTAIAAIAKNDDIPILTANIRHFERLDGLKIRPYT